MERTTDASLWLRQDGRTSPSRVARIMCSFPERREVESRRGAGERESAEFSSLGFVVPGGDEEF